MLFLIIVALLVVAALWYQRRSRPDAAISEDTILSAEIAERIEETASAEDTASGPRSGTFTEKLPPRESALPEVAPKQIMRWVAGLSPPLVPLVPNAIPTTYRGRVEIVKGPNGTMVCQHLPHPGGKDYLLFQLEDMPITEEDLRRAQWGRTTVVVTLQNNHVTGAQVPRQLDWGRGLWQQRSGWYRGGR